MKDFIYTITVDIVGEGEGEFVSGTSIGDEKDVVARGYSFDVEAGKTYWLFNPKSQIGIYGFYFSAGSAGIANVKAELDSNAPRYNLAGQKVAENYKGVVIQNGHKRIQK